MKIVSKDAAGFIITRPNGLPPVGCQAVAGEAPATLASINQHKASLAGKTVTAVGKVFKVNSGSMGRNFPVLGSCAAF